jgi:hypothetical protein
LKPDFAPASFAVPRAVREALVAWEHSADYPLPKSKDWTAAGGGGGFVKTYKLGEEHAFLADHVVDGRILMPVGDFEGSRGLIAASLCMQAEGPRATAAAAECNPTESMLCIPSFWHARASPTGWVGMNDEGLVGPM